MHTVLSHNECEALSRFVAELISEVDKLSKLFESRGADASLTRAAQANLQATLEHLQCEDEASLVA
jgi:hypothetical protein